MTAVAVRSDRTELVARRRPRKFRQSARSVEDRRLLIRYQRYGDRRAREQLIQRNMPLARQLARRYYHGREPLEDLAQVAYMGLVKAVDRFDVERSTSFSSYAVPTILGELRRYFRDVGWTMHVPRGLQERVLAVQRAVERSFEQTGRAATPGEIARAINATLEEVLEALDLAQADSCASLDGSLHDSEGERETLAERVGRDDDGYELAENRQALVAAIKRLPQRERLVLGMRFFYNMTQSEIAAGVGCSQMQVSRLIRRSLARLQAGADEPDRPPPVTTKAIQ